MLLLIVYNHTKNRKIKILLTRILDELRYRRLVNELLVLENFMNTKKETSKNNDEAKAFTRILTKNKI